MAKVADTSMIGSKMETIPITDALTAIKFRKEVRKNYLSLPFPIVLFLFFILGCMKHHPVSTLYKVEKALKNTLVSEGSDVLNSDTKMKFLNIGKHEDVFDWMQHTMIPDLLVTTDYNGNDLENSLYGRTAYYNRILGAIEFKTTYAEEVTCDAQGVLGELFAECHNPKKLVIEKQYMDADTNTTQATKYLLRRKRKGEWINYSTQTIEITVATYNGELGAYGVTTLTLEFDRGGSITPFYKLASIPADPYHSRIDFIPDLVFAVLFFALVFEEIRDIYTHWTTKQMKKYWSDFWNIVDLTTITFITISYFIWLRVLSLVYNAAFIDSLGRIAGIGYDLSTSDEAQGFLSEVMNYLTTMADTMTAYRFISMGACFFLAVRILKHFRFQPRLSILTRTIGRSLNEFGPFLFVFAIVLCAYVVGGSLLFGSQLDGFSTISKSIVTCTNMLFGDLAFEDIKDVDYTIAVLYYWSYMLIVFTVLLNMMLAIVIDAYEDVKECSDTTERSILAEIKHIIEEDMLFRKVNHMASPGPKGTKSKISRDSLLKEITSGQLKGQENLTSTRLMEMFNVTEDVAATTIASLRSCHVSATGGAEKEEDSLETRMDRLETKLDLLLIKLTQKD